MAVGVHATATDKPRAKKFVISTILQKRKGGFFEPSAALSSPKAVAGSFLAFFLRFFFRLLAPDRGEEGRGV